MTIAIAAVAVVISAVTVVFGIFRASPADGAAGPQRTIDLELRQQIHERADRRNPIDWADVIAR
ncbi:hypothetical protein [Flindersiella endophytica]